MLGNVVILPGIHGLYKTPYPANILITFIFDRPTCCLTLPGSLLNTILGMYSFFKV